MSTTSLPLKKKIVRAYEMEELTQLRRLHREQLYEQQLRHRRQLEQLEAQHRDFCEKQRQLWHRQRYLIQRSFPRCDLTRDTRTTATLGEPIISSKIVPSIAKRRQDLKRKREKLMRLKRFIDRLLKYCDDNEYDDDDNHNDDNHNDDNHNNDNHDNTNNIINNDDDDDDYDDDYERKKYAKDTNSRFSTPVTTMNIVAMLNNTTANTTTTATATNAACTSINTDTTYADTTTAHIVKEKEYIALYKYTHETNPERVLFRVVRCGRNHLEYLEKRRGRNFYRPSSSSLSSSSSKRGNNWLTRNCQNICVATCDNSVALWSSIRANNPTVFYGVIFLNRLQTEFEPMSREQLLQKYRYDAANRSKTCNTFEMFVRSDTEDEALRRCHLTVNELEKCLKNLLTLAQ